MKNNWLSVLLGCFCAFYSSFVFSLGLGGITTESIINEPLIAEIELINVGDLENTQILVDIGAQSDYDLAGITREYFHTELQFEVQIEGTANPRIIVRSSRPLSDSYLNFLVQIRWPQGKLLREYTILLDMPLFSQQAATPVATSSSTSNPTTARQAVTQQERQQNQPQQTATTRAVAPRNVSSIPSGQNYNVSTGDTLWGVAEGVARSSGASVHQAMIAIHEQNRDAFVNGDINVLRANSTLRVPSAAQMTSRTEGQAARDFTSLSQAASASPIQATTNNFRDTANNNAQSDGGRLTLSSHADNNGGNAANTDGADSAEDAALREAVTETTNENAALKEQLDAASIEQQEAEERISNLEEQIRLLEEQRLLEIESSTVANIQEAQEAEPQQAEPTVAPAPEPQTFLDKLGAFRYWILGGLALLIVVALLAALLVIRGRKSSDVDELYYDDDEILEEEEVDFVEEESELDESIDELAQEALEDDEEIEDLVENEFEEEIEEELEESLEEEKPARETPESVVATSFEESEDEVDEFATGEFDDLDDFFSGDSSDATEVLFGSDNSGDEQPEDELEEDLEAELDDEDSSLEFTAPDVSAPAEPAEEEPEVHDEEDLLDFDISDLSSDADDSSSEDVDIDLEDDFGFAEPGVTGDLGAEAEADFEESIEVHSSDMDDLLVPADDDSDDELFGTEETDVSGDAFDEAAEELIEEIEEENAEPLMEEVKDEETSLEDAPEDLDLDENMEADLGEFDLDGDDLDQADSDEEFLTKLELAEAYIEMGDVQGAKELLKEVEDGGNEEQKSAARSFLEQFEDNS